MELATKFMTGNDCYAQNKTIAPKGIMVHSTATPGVMAAAWFNRWNKPNVTKCVHAFLDDKEVWQYLPWNRRGWHCGSPGNGTHIGFEICEPGGFKYAAGSTMLGYDAIANQAYFDSIWKNAVELAAYLCKLYGLTEKDVLCHCEGYKKGIATNHADVMHWFPKHGKDMGMLRADVKIALGGTPGAAQAARPTEPLLRRGCVGEHVELMQSTLNKFGYGPSVLAVDGVFGSMSEAAVRMFQLKSGLAADGVCGPKTWAALNGKL